MPEGGQISSPLERRFKMLRYITDRNWIPVSGTKWILYLAGLVFIIFFILFLLGLAMTQDIESILKLPIADVKSCTDRNTGEKLICVIHIDQEQTLYLVIIKETDIRKIIRKKAEEEPEVFYVPLKL